MIHYYFLRKYILDREFKEYPTNLLYENRHGSKNVEVFLVFLGSIKPGEEKHLVGP
jgi:hypothetical protein